MIDCGMMAPPRFGLLIRFCLPFCLVFAAPAGAQTTTYTNLAAYTAATSNTTLIGFNGVLQSGSMYQSFNPLTISGVSFGTSTPGANVNVTAANYYSPNNYTAAFIVDASSTVTGTLNITLPSPTYALALDYGQLFGGGTGSITLSNGFVFNVSSPPTVGNTAFAGFVSTKPITSVSYTVTGDYWVLLDLRVSSLASENLSLSNPIVPAGQSATLTWSASNASSCTASGAWSGPQAASGTVTLTPPSPGYYTYTLDCTGASGATTQSVVLTAYGPTPSIAEPANLLGYQASFYIAPPNRIIGLQTTLTVPPLPPVPNNVDASLFLWAGLAPAPNSANFLPINNGVLQPVLSWGPSCAPTSQPAPFTSWWISGQYVNTFGSDPGYTGCFSGDALLVKPGDALLTNLSLDSSTGDWTETVTGSASNKSVSFTMNLQNQGQNWAYFAIEAWYGEKILTPVTFSNTTLTFQSADTAGWCSNSQGANNNYIMTPPTPQDSGSQCFIGTVVAAQPANPPVLTVALSHTGNFTPGQQGANYTVIVSDTAGTGSTTGILYVTDTVPQGMTLVSMAGAGWSCAGDTCSRSDALAAGSSYPPIAVTVNVAAAAASPLVNQVSVSGGTSAAANASDSTIITAVTASGPAISSGGIGNAASFQPSVAPGSLFTIFGTGLSAQTAGAATLPLPIDLAQTQVLVNGAAVPLVYVSSTQINAQIPIDLPAGHAATVTVTNATGQSNTASVNVVAAAPGIFTYGNNLAVAQNPKGTVNAPSAPASPGDIVVAYLTGGGAVNASGPWISGAASPAGISGVTGTYSVKVGGLAAQVEYIGLTPGFVGLYQANFTVPSLAPGDYPLVVTIGGASSNAAMLAVGK